LGVVEIDERAKMKTKVDELDFGLQTPQSTFWWLDTYQIWWWCKHHNQPFGVSQFTDLWWLGLRKWTPSRSNSYLRLFAFFLEWVFFMGVSIWNGFSVWVLGGYNWNHGCFGWS
jgi:hypothetical protein